MRTSILKPFIVFLFILFATFPTLSKASELVIGTTFAPEAIKPLIDEWNKRPNTIPITTLNRTSASINQLLSTEKAKQVDLVLSSSPMLFYNLQEKNKLAPIPKYINNQTTFLPDILKTSTVAFAFSGYGMLLNKTVLQDIHTPLPESWKDLTNPALQGLIIISSPSRSDTNHIMLEALLQKYGWNEGWSIIERMMINVGTISSRSFGVVDKIQAHLGAIGITIDNYAHIVTQKNNPELIFQYFPQFPTSPTFIAVVAESSKKEQAFKFISFLLDTNTQLILAEKQLSKYPIISLPITHPKAALQQQLFKQPQLNYDLLIKRQQLVKLLFEQHIVHRLSLLQEYWHLLQQKEASLNRTLPELRNILTSLPVSAEQSENAQYLSEFDRSQELLNWQHFFIAQQLSFIKALENLE
ncbi:pesticidal protein Cry1Aa [Gallibacterium salpingitidis]|uniref:Pesticidal protein Cry1Aa n=2 Tax=Gallibacterium salpingitidis TaxID=505341 RepID=A0A1A7P187_9PAST|nr:ABC transporter substrate-binding protein [Gallibacterium salpingitidis]OBW94999.1 pesticidal protein Cry1Aa [Gallibacterium salpingitidis]